MTESRGSNSSDRVTADAFRVAAVQLTVFTPDEELSATKLLRGLLPMWSPVFDAEPVVLPSVAGMPREVPRLILRGQNGAWRCELSPDRVNLVREAPADGALDIAETVDGAARLLEQYVTFQRARVARVGFATTRYVPHSEPAKFLARHFCQPRWLTAPLNRPESLELHAHKKYKFPSGLFVNSWVRNKSGTLAGTDRTVLVVEQDLNTLAEEAPTRDFTATDIKQFLITATSELESILRLYYPNISDA